MKRRDARAAGLLGVLGLVCLSACGYRGGESLPLPGGVSAGEGYEVQVVLSDATNLVPRETCRSNDAEVGTVVSVELTEEFEAKVVCRIRNEVQLPANVVATLRETSLLGERFVALDPPDGAKAEGVLAHGASIAQSRTQVEPNTELVLGALSQVLNGGSLGSIQTILRELNTAMESGQIKQSLRQFAVTVGYLNDHRDEINTALTSLGRLSKGLSRQRSVIADTLDELPAGLAALDRNRPALSRALRRLDRLNTSLSPVIKRSKADVVADLKHATPVLRALTVEGSELAKTLERVVTYPFPSNAPRFIRGDYGGMYGTIHVDVDMLNELLSRSTPGDRVPSTSEPDATDEGSDGDQDPDDVIDDLNELLNGLAGNQRSPSGQSSDGEAPTLIDGLLGLLNGGDS